MNLADEGDLTFKAAVILIQIFQTGDFDIKAISVATEYNELEIEVVLNNLRDNNILVDDKFDIEFEDEEQSWMEFVLICMVGAGEIKRAIA